MNKYQEALDVISNMNTMNLLTIGERSLTKPLVAKLQELVDKETPIKPKEKFDYDNGDLTYCGKCDEDIGFGWSFCPECGQRIDWSDEE